MRPAEQLSHTTSHLFDVGDLSDPRLFLSAIQCAINEDFKLFPIELPPPPPRPAGRGRRTQRRWQRTFSLWSSVCRILSSFNEKGAHSNVTATVMTGRFADANERALRFRFCEVDVRVMAVWKHAIQLVKPLSDWRRATRQEWRTGASVWEKLAKGTADDYGQRADPYQPVIGLAIKELEKGAPKISMLDALPGRLAETIKHPHLMIKSLSQEEEVMAKELRRKYSYFGGAAEQHKIYHSRADTQDLWDFHFDGEEKAVAAFMAVGKKVRAGEDSTVQRKILAACHKIFMWRSPKEVLDEEFCELGMGGPTALTRVTADRQKGMSWGALDGTQAFSAV